MSSRRPFPPPRWRSNAAGLAILALLLQMLFGQAAMLRMAAADGGTGCATHHAGSGADREGAPQPLDHHETCPVCVGFAPMLGAVASTAARPAAKPAILPVRLASGGDPGRPAPAYSSRAPPLA